MKKILVSLLSLALVVFAICYCLDRRGFTDQKTLVIGAKSSLEQEILAEIAAQLLERFTSYNVVVKKNLGSTKHVFQKFHKKQIDLYCEYLGTAYLDILGHPISSWDSEQVNIEQTVKKELISQYDAYMLPPLGFANRYVLVMNKEKAEKRKIFSLSDLVFQQKMTSSLSFGFDPEFAQGSESTIFQDTYALKSYKKVRVMQRELLYSELNKRNLDVVTGYSTDASLVTYPFVMLRDDLGAFPDYSAFFIVQGDVVRKDPYLVEVLEKLESLITEAEMQYMNYQVEKKQVEAYKVARNFLIGKKII